MIGSTAASSVLLSIGEVPRAHPPHAVRQSVTIQQRRVLVHRIVSARTASAPVVKGNGLPSRCKGSWWKIENIAWMKQQAQDWSEATGDQLWRAHLTDLLETEAAGRPGQAGDDLSGSLIGQSAGRRL